MQPSPTDRPAPSRLVASVAGRADLITAGMTARGLTAAVRGGRLLRPRRDHYLPPDAHPHQVEAVRCGGRLDCVALLALLGVFVLETPQPHVQLERDATRLPAPARGVIRHWRATVAHPHAAVVPVPEALAQAVRCQGARAAVATLDSAWHLGLVDEAGIREVFGLLPRRYGVLRGVLDRRSESGTESLVRLILRGFGCRIELQVRIDGVGRVDLLVDGWLILECDSVRHHSDWSAQVEDRRRDLAAAALGYTTVRLLADDVFRRPDWVREQLRRVVAQRPAVHDSGRSGAGGRRSRLRASPRTVVPES
ncbi:endonuclease domain-containing protein [Microbacterium sp. PA5]|uniref:endonuclease domain-containing protein n=1 Tax=Microbacterium sp. PA5 TaxID=3416654 RepID=UPI003CE744C0